MQSGNLGNWIKINFLAVKKLEKKKKKNCEHESTINFQYSQIIIIINIKLMLHVSMKIPFNLHKSLIKD